MKRWTAFLLALALLLSLSACGKATEEQEEAPLRIGALKGPTGMGLAGLMTEEQTDYDFTLAGSADELTPLLLQGELDMACVPANLAAVLYNRSGGAVQVLAVNTLGVLYIVENGESIASVADLEGRTIYAAGKGSVPEYTLSYILSKYNVSASVEWKSEHAECVAALLQDETAVALLPQPFVTSAMLQNEAMRIALDLNQLWEDSESQGSLVTGCIVARREVTEERPDAVADFLDAYEGSVTWVNENAADAAVRIEEQGIMKAAVAEKAIPYCRMVCIRDAEMREMLSGYLSVLAEQNKEAVGGTLPEDDFYYVG